MLSAGIQLCSARNVGRRWLYTCDIATREIRGESQVELRVAFLRKYVYVVLLSGLRWISRCE